MTVATPPARLITPTSGDRSPVELAVISETIEEYGPEVYLGFTFHRPDGGANLWHGWTDGGPELGDLVDGVALAARLDAADWLHIGDRHRTTTDRGRVRIEAYPLRPVLADVHNGERSDEPRRQTLIRFLDVAAAQTGQPRPALALPLWPGFGPARLNTPKGK